MTPDMANLLAEVSEKVYASIKTMVDKQGYTKRPIGLDSISLVLKISITDLAPVMEHLAATGRIEIHLNTSGKSKGHNRPYSISLN